MGMIDRLAAVPQAAEAVTRILERLDSGSPVAATLAPVSARPASRFDAIVDGLNRLPRPFAALGAVGLVVYAMAMPEGFARRMEALASMPEPLWWLIGAIFSLHFGAREAHHFRASRPDGASREGASPVALPPSHTLARPSGADPSVAGGDGL
jgi:hypothetical protein